MNRVVLLCSLPLFLFLPPAFCDVSPGAPFGLLCELLRDPSQAVITDPRPEFCWIVNDRRRGARQSACVRAEVFPHLSDRERVLLELHGKAEMV